MPKKNAIYLYDGRGTYEVGIGVPCEEGAASSRKISVVVYEIHSHLSKAEADALVEKLKKRGAEIEYGDRP